MSTSKKCWAIAEPRPVTHHGRLAPLAGDRDTAIGHDHLAGDVRRGFRSEKHRDAPDVPRLADAPERRRRFARLAPCLVLPQRARKIGFDDSRRNGVDTYALRSPLAGERPAQAEIGRAHV